MFDSWLWLWGRGRACERLPENQVPDFELGLDHTSRPQSYAQNVHLCGDVLRGSDAAHVLKETEKPKRERGEKECEVEEE